MKNTKSERLSVRVDRKTADALLDVAMQTARERLSTEIRISDAVRDVIEAGLRAKGILPDDD